MGQRGFGGVFEKRIEVVVFFLFFLFVLILRSGIGEHSREPPDQIRRDVRRQGSLHDRIVEFEAVNPASSHARIS
jgi:hypothetical protein